MVGRSNVGEGGNMMKAMVVFSVLFFIGLGGPAIYGQPQVEIGTSFGPHGLKSFFFAIQEYFRVPEREVVIVRERKIPEEEIPVVFFIAQRAQVSPAAIIDLRLSGKSWMEITLHFGLSPEIYYVPVRGEIKGPPYGKAYGYYKNKPKKDWKHIKLKDVDVINFVNLRFLSEYHRYPPEDVIKMRGRGKPFVVVHEEIKKGRGKDFDERDQGKEKSYGKGKLKEQSKGKD